MTEKMKLIDKDALVAEIEKLKDKAIDSGDRVKWYLYNDVIKAINTLEVKEVGLEKESLTWKDVKAIDLLLYDMKAEYDNGRLDVEEYYKEVLKKFKAQKGE